MEDIKPEVTVTTKYNKEYQQTMWTVTCPDKRKEPFYIVPNPNGTIGWLIKDPSGHLPVVLEGAWSRHAIAIDKIKHYFYGMPQTVGSKRAKKTEDS